MSPLGPTSRPLWQMLGIWAPLSLFAHVGAGLLIVGFVVCKAPQVGSRELDVDLVQPRLASPPVADEVGQQDRATQQRAGRGRREARALAGEQGRNASEGAPLQATPWPHGVAAARPFAEKRWPGSPRPRVVERVERTVEPQPPSRQQRVGRAVPRRVAETTQLADDGTLAPQSGSVRARDPQQLRSRRPSRRLPAAARRLLTVMSRELGGGVPVHVARELRRDFRRKKQRHRAKVAEVRSRRARVKMILAQLTTSGRAAAKGGAIPGPGRGRGAARRFGLKFYLSGRRVLNSRVVTPPVPLTLPRTSCRVQRLGLPPTTVRLLVGKKGDVPIAYVKHGSGLRPFDACALEHAKGMRFAPGRDDLGAPLDVWIHLRIEPSVRPARRIARPRRAALRTDSTGTNSTGTSSRGTSSRGMSPTGTEKALNLAPHKASAQK